MDIPMDYHVWGAMLERCQTHAKRDQHCRAERLFHWRHGMICHRSSFITQSYHFPTAFNLVLLQLLEILKTLFKYWVGSWHSSVVTETFELLTKSCGKSDLLFLNVFNAQLHVHLKKWTLKFKLLCQLNRVSCFNKICTICCSDSGHLYTKSESSA